MKLLLIAGCLLVALHGFAQTDIMDSIKMVQDNNSPEAAKSFCTDGFWNASRDGGERVFKQLVRMGDDVEFVVSDEKTNGDRALLVLDFMRDGEKRDEVYLYAVKDGDHWMMDGFNESKRMIEPFLNGDCSGHFVPTDLPSDPELEKVGKKMLEFTRDREGLITYLKSISTENSEFSSVIVQVTDESFTTSNFKSAGYSKEMDLGYIYLELLDEDGYDDVAVIYVRRMPNGKYYIHNYSFGGPSSRGFFMK